LPKPPPEKIAFSKPALVIDDQITLLENRGLTVANRDLARRYLENISYYRLSGYTRYFADPADGAQEKFRASVSLDDVIRLYIFDRRLRTLFNEALERIEVAVKSAITNYGSTQYGPFWLCDPANFDHGSHDKITSLVNDACTMSGPGKYKQIFLESFYTKYNDPKPPAWMLMETFSFHGASIVYKYMRGTIRLPVAAQFNVQHDTLESWLHSLVFVRNVCAHHARLWNRQLTITARIPHAYKADWAEVSRNRIYVPCCIIRHLLDQLGTGSSWHERLRKLIAERPNVPLASMGFPDDWEQRAFWGFEGP